MKDALLDIASAALIFLIFIGMPLFTFGYAGNHAKCLTPSANANDCALDVFMQGIFSGIGWPLYWSWKLQETK